MATGFPVKDDYVTGDVLTAANMNDLSGTVNTLESTGYAAGKNALINGAFNVWQRGTSFSNPTNGTYTADRWFVELDGSSYTRTISQQTFTPGTAPEAGYEGTYFFRWNNSVAGTGNTINAISQRIEDIRTFAGQTVTLSFWAKADAARALTVFAYQQSSGGSGTVTTTVGSATLTTSWARYTMTVALPSMAGVTIGTNSNLQIRIAMPIGVTMTCDFWGMQLEASPVASEFQTATGTLQGELAACQRYFQKSYPQGTAPATNSTANGLVFGAATATLANNAYVVSVRTPIVMRSAPTVTIYSFTTSQTARVSDATGTDLAASSGGTNLIGDSGFAVQNTSGGSITAANGGFVLHYQASAEL